VSSSLFAVATFLYLSGFLAVTLFSKHLIALREYLVSGSAQSPARHTTTTLLGKSHTCLGT
jgi:hypothetical protein